MATVPHPHNMTLVERLSWESAISRMNWWPGEHVTFIGPTGRGKTEALIALMRVRRYGVFLSTKRKDETASKLEKERYRVIHDPAEINADVSERLLFRPRFPRAASADEIKSAHSLVYSRALMRLREQMGWTIGVDETHYLTHFLRLSDELELLWLQGRSEGTTVIANTQRPRNIPLVAYSQARHLFFWTSPDSGDIRRIGEMTPLPVAEVEAVLATQDEHTMLYLNTVTREMFQTNTRW